MLGEAAVIEGAGLAARAAWQAMDAKLLPDPGTQTLEWLREREVRAVIVRPDRHVFGVARDAAGLAALSARLAPLCHAAA